MMRLLSSDKTSLMDIERIERDGHDLLIRGKVFGTMPMTARLTPAECRNGLKLLNGRLILFLLTLPFRRI
jgi:hypothetical protein